MKLCVMHKADMSLVQRQHSCHETEGILSITTRGKRKSEKNKSVMLGARERP